MADIRKRVGKKGTTYQVRYPSKSTQSGYAFETFDTLKEARVFREDSRARNAKGSPCLDVITVQQAVDKWLDICEKEGLNGREPVTQYTHKNYEYRAEFIKGYDWRKALQELEAPDIVEFRSWLLRGELSRDLARKTLSSFQSVIKEMALRGIVSNNMAVGVGIRNDSRYQEPVIIPSKKDIVALLSAADRLSNSKNRQTARTWQRYRPMLYLAVDSGMRPQEYIAISKSAIKINGVQVERAIDGSGQSISVTKTPAGRRFIELSPVTLAMVRYYADHHAIENDYDLVFPVSNGSWQCRRNWQKRGFNAACIEAGLVEDFVKDGVSQQRSKYRPYDLRHFYASMLFEKRTNLKKIQVLMGHTKIETTLNVYGHLLEDDTDNLVKAEGMLSGMLGV